MPGQAVALVGASGAGKTTIVNLLPSFYDPEFGDIFIDGVNIRDVTLNSLRKQIGIFPQETIMFSGTIAQNIAFGQNIFDINAVESAAKIANADQFIQQLPEGYHTWVGERGVNLSGGQRQRIAIARALVSQPKIILADEPTAALDRQSGRDVVELMQKLAKEHGCTILLVTHDNRILDIADRIVYMEDGHLVREKSDSLQDVVR
jgi:ATP-binding cassette subfamily B protein